MASCKRKVYKTMCEQDGGDRHGRYKAIRYESTPKKGARTTSKAKATTRKPKAPKKPVTAKKPKLERKPDENTRLLAKWFSARGSDITTQEEFVMSVSLEHKWMSPTEAKKKLKELLDKGYLMQRGGFIRPTYYATDPAYMGVRA